MVMLSALGMVSCKTTEPNGGGNGDEQSPRMIKVAVLDYSPAPGQFVNELPLYEAGDTPQSMRLKAEDALNNGRLITLGAFGGSVTLRLSEPITPSHDGSPEFRVLGNAFLNTAETAVDPIGSCEPGIVMVMTDVNANGLPDDTWYVLGGDHFDEAVESHVTYIDNSAASNDRQFVQWSDQYGATGWLTRNVSHHNHAFFPMWLDMDRCVVEGYRLPDNGRYNEITSTYDLSVYGGYADAWPNNSMRSALSLSSARTLDGAPATVVRVDFVRIYTGVLQCNGPLGECSTEVAGIQRLN